MKAASAYWNPENACSTLKAVSCFLEIFSYFERITLCFVGCFKIIFKCVLILNKWNKYKKKKIVNLCLYSTLSQFYLNPPLPPANQLICTFFPKRLLRNFGRWWIHLSSCMIISWMYANVKCIKLCSWCTVTHVSCTSQKLEFLKLLNW